MNKYFITILKDNKEMTLKIRAKNKEEAITKLNNTYNIDKVVHIADELPFINPKADIGSTFMAYAIRRDSKGKFKKALIG